MRPGRLSAILALTLVFLLMLAAVPKTTSAFPFRLEGYLKDDTGNPIANADLHVRGQIFVFNGTEQSLEFRTADFPEETDATGYFEIVFGVDEPDGFVPGNTVTVFFDDGSREASESLTVSGERAWLNLTATIPAQNGEDYAVPIFIVVIVIVVFVLVLVFIRSRDKKIEEEETTEEARTKVGRRRK